MIDIIVPPVVQVVPLSGINEDSRKPYMIDNQIVKKLVQVQVGPPTTNLNVLIYNLLRFNFYIKTSLGYYNRVLKFVI